MINCVALIYATVALHIGVAVGVNVPPQTRGEKLGLVLISALWPAFVVYLFWPDIRRTLARIEARSGETRTRLDPDRDESRTSANHHRGEPNAP